MLFKLQENVNVMFAKIDGLYIMLCRLFVTKNTIDPMKNSQKSLPISLEIFRCEFFRRTVISVCSSFSVFSPLKTEITSLGRIFYEPEDLNPFSSLRTYQQYERKLFSTERSMKETKKNIFTFLVIVVYHVVLFSSPPFVCACFLLLLLLQYC